MRRSIQAQEEAAQTSREVLQRVASRRDEAWRQAAADSRRRALLLVALPLLVGVVVALLGLVLLPLAIVGLLLLIGWGVVASLAWRSALTGPGTRLGGMKLDEAVRRGLLPALAAERYADVAESLCAALGLALPELRVLDDPAANAITAGGRPDRVQLVLTTGLLAKLDRIELEGVLAHELVHVKRLDTLSGGLSASLLRGGRLAVPGAGRLARWLEGEDRELEADLAAVQVTRYPPGLIGALATAAGLEEPSVAVDGIPEGTSAAAPVLSVAPGILADTRSQWLVPFEMPGQEIRGDSPKHPGEGAFTAAERLAVLREL